MKRLVVSSKTIDLLGIETWSLEAGLEHAPLSRYLSTNRGDTHTIIKLL